MDHYNIMAIAANACNELTWMKANDPRAARHLEGGNFLFFDGHAKWFNRNNRAIYVADNCPHTASDNILWNPQGTVTY